MASKLFRAVVGVGISVGGASAACVGLSVPNITGASDAGDAALEVVPDAAWCDAAWPTTKSNPIAPPACIDSEGLCKNDALVTPDELCMPAATSGECPVDAGAFLPFCIAGKWTCASGTKLYRDCPCLPGTACDGGAH